MVRNHDPFPTLGRALDVRVRAVLREGLPLRHRHEPDAVALHVPVDRRHREGGDSRVEPESRERSVLVRPAENSTGERGPPEESGGPKGEALERGPQVGASRSS